MIILINQYLFHSIFLVDDRVDPSRLNASNDCCLYKKAMRISEAEKKREVQ